MHRPSIQRFITPFGLLLPALLLGCPDPNPVSSYDELTPSGPGTGATVSEAPPDEGATQPNEARFRVNPGEGVKLEGSFVYAGTITGQRRLDFRTIPVGEGAPRLVHTLEIRSGDTWDVEVPKDLGQLQIHAFIDRDGDGPTKGDPGYVTDPPLKIGQDAVPPVILTLTDDFDPSVLAPGGAPGGLRPVQGDPSGEMPAGDLQANPSEPAPGPAPVPTPEGN